MGELRAVIDGRSVEVEPGTTILDAARQLGLQIPTLCHVPGHEPAVSCFLCAVQVAGRRALSPACAMPVEDGMEVATRSADVRQARKMALELLLSDHAGDCVAPCAARCPAGLDIPAFVREIAAGEPAAAIPVLFDALTLPGTLGRICPRLCETACRRCSRDQSLAIGALHRYAADRAATPTPTPPPSTGKSVAIVGARFRFGVLWGRDFDLAALRREHDAVFLAIGAQRSRRLGCAGEELAMAGLELLARVAAGERPELGARAVVIGGGNTAMDAARTARRLGSEVAVFYRRSRAEMPCLLDEVEAAEEEGVRLEVLCAPTRLERRPDGRIALHLVRMEDLGAPDASGRRSARPVAGSQRAEVVDTVIAAVGQSVENDLAEREGLATTPWGIAVDPHTLETNLTGVFAGGDAVLGASDALREARRCLSCGCSAAGGCGLRRLATEYGADPKRFTGARRRFARDDSHPEIVYEPGKCILCGACVAVAEAAADGRPGIALVGRGFETVMATAFGTSMAESLGAEVARRCAEVCPTGAIALRTARACDFVRLGRGG